jgi:alanine-glyoxylate transaminase/serine-glyoxylate transaminase/serine-pyruvate transaminase
VRPRAWICAALKADTEGKIKAVGAVQNETSTGMHLPIDQVRAAIDAAGHDALLMVDTISSLGCMDLRMDEWKLDVVVGGSQKGLMLPTGMAFTGVSDKAMKAAEGSTMPKHYLNWKAMAARKNDPRARRPVPAAPAAAAAPVAKANRVEILKALNAKLDSAKAQG